MSTHRPTTFRFTERAFDAASGTLTLGYAYPGAHTFNEEIVFGPPTRALDGADKAALENAFRALHLAAGVSYYKAFVPETIEVDEGPLDDGAADFFEALYFGGLGEFAYRNELDLTGRISFPRGGAAPTAPQLSLPQNTLVPVGGGKDSLVTVEALRKTGNPITLAAVNKAKPITQCIEESGLPSLFVMRRVDPALLALNDNKELGAYNGHVPITAIVSLILVCAAILHGHDAIAFSNERSADEGNLEVNGHTVNHQFSKSKVFEMALRGHIESHIAKGLSYFSFLRPLSELHIAKLFAVETRYDHVFTSCNKSYRIEGAMTDRRWCGKCPKCRFVFLALAPFVAQARLLDIFGTNLLDDENQTEGFRELVGLGAHKPWECVGETLESAAAMWALTQYPQWKDAAVVSHLKTELAPGAGPLTAAIETAMTPASPETLPELFQKALADVVTE